MLQVTGETHTITQVTGEHTITHITQVIGEI